MREGIWWDRDWEWDRDWDWEWDKDKTHPRTPPPFPAATTRRLVSDTMSWWELAEAVRGVQQR